MLPRQLARPPVALDRPGGGCERQASAEEAAQRECRHKFVDSNRCAHCSVHVEELRKAGRAELARLREEAPPRGELGAG